MTPLFPFGKIGAGIHQFHAGSAVGDAVTNSMFFIQDCIASAGLKSEIWVQDLDPRLADRLKPIKHFRPSPDDLLIIHHSMGHDSMPLLQALQCRKLLLYHNITPPEFFKADQFYADYSRRGYAQLADLRSMVVGSIADSSYNAQELRRRGYVNVETIPLLGDFAACRKAPFSRAAHYFETPRYQLLFVGRIAPNKCQLDLVRFMAEYADSFEYPLHLLLVGSQHFSRYLSDVEREITDYGLEKRVTLTGHVPDEELYGHYRASDAYVSLSEHEGFGVPLVEAMAFDLPIIAYDSSAVGSTLGRAGRLIPDKRPKTIARSLRPLLEDRVARRALIRTQRERFSDFDAGRNARALFRFIEPFAPPGTRDAIRRASEDACDPVVMRREYIVEGPCETSYSLAVVNRCLALALNEVADVDAVLVPAEGVPHYLFNQAEADRRPEIHPLMRPAPFNAVSVVTIRNMYPHRPAGMQGDLRLMNFFWEETLAPQNIVRLMNRYLDGVVVASRFGRTLLRNSGVRVPIAIVGCGVDHIERTRIERADERSRRSITNTPFTFLHISSGLARKGIEELFVAFAAAFSANDDVRLVIKTYENETNVVRHWFEALIAGRHNAPFVQIVTDNLGECDMLELYETADVVVLPTRGEGFNLPAAEALALGKPVVTTGFSAHMDFCDQENSWLVDYDLEYSTSHLRSLGSMWARPRVSALVQVMREFYAKRNSDLMSEKSAAASKTGADMTWGNVAENVERFVDALETEKPVRSSLKTAWVSTWNTRCGIAAYSSFLTSALSAKVLDITVFGNKASPNQPDASNVVRNWVEASTDIDQLISGIKAGGFDIAVFQYNFGFFRLSSLGAAIAALDAQGIDVYVFFHSTTNASYENDFLTHHADFARAQRLIVHTLNDVTRLKNFGLVDNVVLLPQGVYRSKNQIGQDLTKRLLGIANFRPIVASYGFLFPHKGMGELILAFGLLLKSYPDALLLLVTSQYSDIASAQEAAFCRELITHLGLNLQALIVDEYLPDDESLLLLEAADVVVYPYQDTLESSSAAVRFGLASGRPVAVTPLPIFTETADATFKLPGLSARDIAAGLEKLLSDAGLRRDLARAQEKWVSETSWDRVAERFTNLTVGLHEDRHGVRVNPVNDELRAKAVRRSPEGNEGSVLIVDLSSLTQDRDSDFVAELYRRLLMREADEVGLDTYSSALRNGDQDRASVIETLLSSEEFLASNRPIRVVGQLPETGPQGLAGSDMSAHDAQRIIQ